MHDGPADAERGRRVAQRLVRHGLELGIRDRVGLPAEALALGLGARQAGPHALDNPATRSRSLWDEPKSRVLIPMGRRESDSLVPRPTQDEPC